MKVSTRKYACLAALLAGMSFPALATNITFNGSFEDGGGDFSGWTHGGWVIDNGLPQSGIFEAVTFCGGPTCISNPDAFMSQNLTTVIGTTYALSFWYSNELAGGPGSNELQALVGGVPLVDLINKPADTTYRQILVAFTATTITTSLEFRGRSDQDFLLVDNVCVDVNNGAGVCGVASTVPEPSSLLITGTGALALLGFRRRRLKKRS